jgi:hypothetical protein
MGRRTSAIPVALALVSAIATSAVARPNEGRATSAEQAPAPPLQASVRDGATHHYEYVFVDGTTYVYDIDHGHRLVQQIALPEARGIRGAAVSPQTGRLYVSYGADGGAGGTGSLLAYDLLRDRLLWTRSYATGIDSMALSRDGRKIYMPTGELSPGRAWKLLDARSGAVEGEIEGGVGPHNTIVGLSGKLVYLGGRNDSMLYVASTRTNRIVARAGPLRGGVRPFTINGRETLAYTTATGFLGFQVSSLRTGRVLYTVPIAGYSWDPATFHPSAPSHGISLSPNERELWVIDAPNSAVHVFDVSKVPRSAPRLIANVALPHALTGDESPCLYDCARDGWLQHSRDGRWVYVGDSGDVIDARSKKPAAFLETLANTRKMVEVDWRRGRPTLTTTRSGIGYVR